MPYTRLSYNCQVLDARGVDLSTRLWSTGFAAGFGVYETLRVDAGQLRHAEAHAERLLQSANLIDLGHPWSREQIMAAALALVLALCDAQDSRDFNIRILLLGAASAESAELWMHAQDRREPSATQYAQGVTAQTARAARYLPLAKSMGQLAAYQAYRAASAAGHYEALLVDASGMICEGSRSNFVGIQGENLLVAPRDAVLGGVTQMQIETLARDLGMQVSDTGVPYTALDSLDAAFLCGTSIGVLPLCSVDAHGLSVSGPWLHKLHQGLRRH